MLKMIALALLLVGLAGCGPLALPSMSASSSTTAPQPLNGLANMRCNGNVTMTGC
jgi:predicted small lipoprotein YifL